MFVFYLINIFLNWLDAVFSLLYIPSRTITFKRSKGLNKAGEIPTFIFAWHCHLANPMKVSDLLFAKYKRKLKIYFVPNELSTCIIPCEMSNRCQVIFVPFFVHLVCLLFPITISERLFGLKCGKRMIYLLIVAVLAMIFGNTCWWYSAVLKPLYIYAFNIQTFNRPHDPCPPAQSMDTLSGLKNISPSSRKHLHRLCRLKHSLILKYAWFSLPIQLL